MRSLLKYLFDFDDIVKSPITNFYKANGVVVEENLCYHDFFPEGVCDVYYPERHEGKLPILFNVHGGGWVTGDKKWRKTQGNMFAEDGIFVVNPNYRLAPGYKFPQCLRDIFDAANWVFDNADRFNLDKDRFYVTGDSAGAHLATCMAAYYNKPQMLEKLGITPLKFKSIKRAFPLCGVYNFDRMAKTPGSGGIFKDVTGLPKRKFKEFEFYKEISPVYFIDESFPPVFVLSAGADIFTRGQTDCFKEKLKEKNVPYISYEGHGITASDHCYYMRYEHPQSRYVFEKIKALIQSDAE